MRLAKFTSLPSKSISIIFTYTLSTSTISLACIKFFRFIRMTTITLTSISLTIVIMTFSLRLNMFTTMTTFASTFLRYSNKSRIFWSLRFILIMCSILLSIISTKKSISTKITITLWYKFSKMRTSTISEKSRKFPCITK